MGLCLGKSFEYIYGTLLDLSEIFRYVNYGVIRTVCRVNVRGLGSDIGVKEERYDII